jgi:predicted nucleotidyltransferase component of viral defense system
LGFDVRSKITEHPKIYWRAISHAETPLRIKVEVNTHERSPALPLVSQSFQVESPWWTGQAEVRTFQLAELIATKIRALYQRSKGRDLFDLWLALTTTELNPDDVLAAFGPYRPAGHTSQAAIANLRAKLATPDFRHDLDELTAQPPALYDPDQAAALVTASLLDLV